MKETIKAERFTRLLVIVFVTVILQSGVMTMIAQEDKEKKCQELSKCLETFYKDCLNDDYLSRYSPELSESFTTIINHEDEMARLDNYLSVLNDNPTSTGYIVVYGGRTNKYGEYDIRVGRIKDYIFGFRKKDESRIKFVNGGFREKFEFELWRSPIKNSFPPLSPTVAPEKVRFKGKMKPFGI